MLLEIGTFLLAIERDPFQLIFPRSGNICLRTSPLPEPVKTINQTGSSVQVEFSHFSLTIHQHNSNGLDLQVSPATANLSLSFEMLGQWYGHGELINQIYPLNRLMLPESPFQTFDNGPAGQSSKLTPAWYSSKGLLVYAHTDCCVGINQPPLSYPRYNWSLGAEKGPFAHRPFADPYNEGNGLLTVSGKNLHLSIFFENDALSAYWRLITITGHPRTTPPAELFAKPTWTTWARYKTAISQETVLSFAEEIIHHGYLYGIMEIDDRWQVHYGDISFDPARFSDPKGMIQYLHTRGFKVTAWVIPFLDPESHAFIEGRAKGYLVRQQSGETYLVPWWQGRGGLLDVTNPAAVEWFRERLERLRDETGLDGYKFDAGEAAFYPTDACSVESISPNEYTHRYIDFIARHFRLTEARSGWMNQTAPIFFRQWDKWTTWGKDNGLQSVLTGILALSLTGYPFILPDMVGGNEYDDDHADAELMIRWTQLTALLPAMQFSLAPWDRGEKCTSICRKYAEIHLEFAPRIFALAVEATQTGAPIIRPVWWLAPQNEHALSCADQFLLGSDILVAPVMHPGQRARDIYLPPGKWRDYWNGQIYTGDAILKEYPTPLDILPIFEKDIDSS